MGLFFRKEGRMRKIYYDAPFATLSQRRQQPNSYMKDGMLEGGK